MQSLQMRHLSFILKAPRSHCGVFSLETVCVKDTGCSVGDRAGREPANAGPARGLLHQSGWGRHGCGRRPRRECQERGAWGWDLLAQG